MDELWRNPEFVRRRRMELRPARMVIAASISTLLCLLLLLLIQQMDGSAKEHVAAFYTTLVFVQALVLCLTCLSACGQAISSERSLKTYDFLRTTRLTSAELLFGMIFGAPVMGYYLLACTLPFSLISGLIAGFPVPAIIVTYILMLLVAVVMSLIALTSSMVTEKPRPGELLVDRVGVFTPCNRREGFEVFDLALRLDDHVLWREAVAGLGKEPDERGLIVAVCVGNDGIRAAFHLSVRPALHTAPGRLQLAVGPIDQHRINDVDVPGPHSELQHIARHGGHCSSAKNGRRPKRVGVNVEKFSFDGDRRTKRHEETFVRSVFIAAIFVSEDSQPASALRSGGQIHAPHEHSTALFGGK